MRGRCAATCPGAGAFRLHSTRCHPNPKFKLGTCRISAKTHTKRLTQCSIGDFIKQYKLRFADSKLRARRGRGLNASAHKSFRHVRARVIETRWRSDARRDTPWGCAACTRKSCRCCRSEPSSASSSAKIRTPVRMDTHRAKRPCQSFSCQVKENRLL